MTIHSFTARSAPRVSDLVLDPFIYSDTLGRLARDGRLAHELADRLAEVLPAAIAQLDALGDSYGAIALDSLYGHLAGMQAVA